MSMQTPLLPAPPVQEEPTPEKQTTPRWPFIAGAALLAVAIIAGTNDKAPAATGTTAIEAPACVDLDASSNYLDDAMAELTASGTAATSYDLDGAADHLENVSADLDEVTSIFADYPTITRETGSASSTYQLAADALRSGDINSATSLMSSATSDITAATAATEAAASDIVPC